MASVVEQLESLVLSAADLANLTGWPDAMIEDYLNILRNIILLGTSVDQDNAQIEANTLAIEVNEIAIAALSILVQDNADAITLLIDAVDDLETGKADKIVPATTNNISTLSASGNLQDSGFLISSLIPLSGTGSPEGVITANDNGFFVDTVAPQNYYNPVPGANTGWLAV